VPARAPEQDPEGEDAVVVLHRREQAKEAAQADENRRLEIRKPQGREGERDHQQDGDGVDNGPNLPELRGLQPREVLLRREFPAKQEGEIEADATARDELGVPAHLLEEARPVPEPVRVRDADRAQHQGGGRAGDDEP
jgi:hypothetical protein